MLSIVILSHNRREDVEKTIPKLITWCEKNNAELIFVDNASSDGTQEFIKGIQASTSVLTLVENIENRGVAGGRNDGFRVAIGDVILCLDDDSEPEIEFLNDLEHLFEVYPEAGIITPLIRHANDGSAQNESGPDPAWVANFHGCCHSFRRNLLDLIGFQDEFCTFGGEEFDFSVRAHKVGLKTLYHPDYVCFHNSFVRPLEEQMARWSRWAYNYARVIGKNFPRDMAIKFAKRYTNLFAFKMVRMGQRENSKIMLAEGERGLADGIAAAEPCPKETVKFYSNPNLMPEYGNRTLGRKLIGKIVKPRQSEELLPGRR